jgi:hypothetical protein
LRLTFFDHGKPQSGKAFGLSKDAQAYYGTYLDNMDPKLHEREALLQ